MHPDAEIRLPAGTAYVAVLRMAAAGFAARLDFTLDDIEDLKMAVSEACALVLVNATPGGDLRACFFFSDQQVEIEVTADAIGASAPDQDSFGWQVLTTSAARASASVTAESVTVRLAVMSSTFAGS